MKNEVLSLTISADDGRLLVLLSDSKRLSTHGWARTDLQNIQNVASVVEPSVLQELVFPVSINQEIAKSQAAVLLVQITQELAFLPIEAFQSAGQRWCERFAMAFYLSSLEAPIVSADDVSSETNKQILISFTDKLSEQQATAALKKNLSSHGLSLVENDSITDGSHILIACSANDADRHISDKDCGAPQVCVWPSDSQFQLAETDIARFSSRHQKCVILTGHQFTSITDLVMDLIPALCALNNGATLLWAVQAALQKNGNSSRTFRLYHCDDTALCQPPKLDRPETENRTITAMSLDVVASTQMIQRLGSERYSEILAALKERCIESILERGGSSGGRAGDDSTMAYFGLPNALENTAANAMDTALAIRSILPALPGQPEVRIGIATGRVAVRSGVPYGEAIHLAARLQGFGRPGDIIVDTASQWLAREDYDFEQFGEYTAFHGIDHPILPLRLIAHARDKSLSLKTTNFAPFIGRTAEMKELSECWERVCNGEQHVVCVRGEGGIGKSRLAREFVTKVARDGAGVLKISGLSDYQGGVFYSVKESLKRLYGIQPGDSRAKIQQRVCEVGSFPSITVRNIAQVAEQLGLSESAVTQKGDQQAQTGNIESRLREVLSELLTEAIDAAARDKPLVLMVDDLQWIDPSAREVLEHVINVLRPSDGLRLLVLCTERNDRVYRALPHARLLILSKLRADVAHQFIRNVVGDSLPAKTVDGLVSRAVGVPLFLEESARLALDTPSVSLESIFSVPDSIDSLLMSRLDKLDTHGKYLVQVAAVIGKDVPIDLLRSVANDLSHFFSDIDFQNQVKTLRKFGVLIDLKAKGPPRLAFRHEMFRDVAYTSMWKSDCVAVHAAVARVIQNDDDQLFAAQPSMIAHHLASSEQHEPAATQWELAARQAADASANQEAIHNLRLALLSLEQVSNSDLMAKQEMRLQLMLAARLIASEGYGAEEVRSAYERAEVLVRQFGDKRDQLKVKLGLESVHVMRGELKEAEALAVSAVDFSNQLPDRKLRRLMSIQARWALGNIKFHQGYPRKALTLMDRCLQDCKAISHRSFAVQDPEIMCLCYGAWALWEMGFSDAGYQRAAHAVELARTRRHAFSEAEALGFYASLAMFRGEHTAAIEHSDSAIVICKRENFSIWLAHAQIIRGRSLTLCADQSEGLVQMEQGYLEWVGTGAVITRAFYLSLIAETLYEAGALDSAENRLCEAESIIASTGDRYHLAEIKRIKGLIAYEKEYVREGDSRMDEAIDIANAQSKHSFVLKASIAKAESLVKRQRYADAIKLVEQSLSQVPDGMSTGALTHAKTRLSTWCSVTGKGFHSLESPPAKTKVAKSGCVLAFPKSAND